MGLQYTIERTEPRLVRLAGEIDVGVASEAVDVITDTVLDGDPVRMVVDISQVSLLDSTGVAALVTAKKIAAHRGCDLVVANPAAVVREQMAVTGVLEFLLGDEPPRQRSGA
ncbi:MAG TPA: STAS domain-containing protein [Natronosporangium sp.]|nr:STAS domain-containing protein [Natronosporangium sp.]